MANQVDFKILPSDQFNVYSPQTRSDKVITYFTLLSKLRGDILAVGQEDDPNDIVSAYYSTVGGTQTLHLVKADGSEVTASYTISTSTETQNASTGILVGGELTASIGGTTFSISAGVGQIVSQAATSSGVSTIVTPISWDAFSAITPTNLTTQPFTYLYIDSVGALQQQATPFTDVQYKSSIIIGHLCHIDLATINLVTSDQNVAYGTPTRLLELIQTFGPIKKQGLTLSANGSNLRINRSSGEGFIIGSNYQIDQFDPDKIIISAKIPSLLCRIYRNGSGGYVFDNNGGSYYNNIDPTKYDNGSGTLQTVNNNQWTIQRLYTFPSAPDDIICYYGTQIYNSQGDAIDNIPYEPFSEAPITALNSIFLGYVIPRGGASNLSSLGDATFIQAGLFRGLGSGGGSTTNLKLEDLSDVVITSPQNQDFLFYNSTSQEWQNVAVGAFKTIAVASQSDVVADSYNDTLTLVAGSNVTITTSAVADTITISSTDQYVGTVTSVDMSVPTGFAISGNPITTSGTLALAFASGYSLPTNATQANWTTAYNDSITAFSYNTSTGVLTLTQQDVGTLTATVTLQPFSTTNLTEGTNLYFTTTRARQSLSAGTGISYDNSTGVITNSAPDQIVSLSAGTGISTSGTYPSFTITNTLPDQTVVLNAGTGITTSGTYPNFTITNSDRGSSQNIFKNIAVAGQSTIIADSNDDTLTVASGTGISLATNATSDTLTITNTAPDQTVVLNAGTGISTSGTYPNFTITNTLPDQTVVLTGAGTTVITGTYPSFTITSNDQYDGTVTSVAALTLGTTGTDLSSTVANGSTTPVITLNVPTASATNRGALSSTDWTTFNSKQNAITLTTTGNSGAATFVSSTLNIPEYTLTGLGGVPTTRTLSINGTSYDLSANRTWSVGTVTSINLTAGDRIEVSGGPITSSGSITVTHGTATGADFTTAEAFRDRVIADGGIFEALGEVAIAIGSLEDAASPTSTDYSDGFVLQNIAVDEFGHVLGVGATDLDERYAQVAFKNVAVSGQATIVADAIEDTLNIAAGYGVSITTDDTTDTVTIGSQFIPYPVYAASMYQSALTTPFVVTSSWSVVNIDGTNIQLSAPVDSDGYDTENLATVMISIENQSESAAFVCVGIRLYNQTQSAIITDSTRTWTGYLDAVGRDSANTIFTYHIPIEEYVVAGDTIRVQMIDLNSLEPRVNFASFSLLGSSGPV